MANPKKPFRLLNVAWSFLGILYNDRFWWALIKSYGFFALAIPLANTFDGYEILPAGI